MDSNEETGFVPGSATGHPCVLGQVSAFLLQDPHLQKDEVSNSVCSASLYYPSLTLATMVLVWGCVDCHSVDATEALDRLPAPPFPLQSVIHTAARGSVPPPNMVAWFPGRNLSALPRALSPRPTFLNTACRIFHELPPALFSTCRS